MMPRLYDVSSTCHLPGPAPAGCRVIPALVSSALALASAGCTTPQLDSRLDLPASFATSREAAEPDVQWWESYGDPVLSELIVQAAHANRDIASPPPSACAPPGREDDQPLRPPAQPGGDGQCRPATAAVAVARQATRNEQSLHGPERLVGSGSHRPSAGRRGHRRGRGGASEAQARGVRLLADVAKLFSPGRRTAPAGNGTRHLRPRTERTLRLVTARQQVGLASPSMSNGRAPVPPRHAGMPRLATLIAVSRHRLAVRSAPSDRQDRPFPSRHQDPAGTPRTASQPAGASPGPAGAACPSWRPRTGVASKQKYQWFPRLFVSALFGREGSGCERHGARIGRFGNIAGLLTMPLLDWGPNQRRQRIAESAQSEALLRYEGWHRRRRSRMWRTAWLSLRDERERARRAAKGPHGRRKWPSNTPSPTSISGDGSICYRCSIANAHA